MTANGLWYEIRVAEEIESCWLEWFLGFAIVTDGGQPDSGTLLRGSLPDQSALFGMLARVRDLNLTLLEVRRLEKD